MNKNKNQFAGLFNATIHTINSTDVDAGHKGKADATKICEKAKLYTVESVKVNSIEAKAGPGGVPMIVINGGTKGLTFGEHQQFITNESQCDFSSVDPNKKEWFSDFDLAADICNALNNSEASRLESIALDLSGQCGALRDVVTSNNQRRVIFAS